jgi:hypothetical protein
MAAEGKGFDSTALREISLVIKVHELHELVVGEKKLSKRI